MALILFPLSLFFLPNDVSISINWIDTFILLANTVFLPLLVSLIFLKVFGQYTHVFKSRAWYIIIRLVWSIILGVSASKISYWYSTITSFWTVEILLPIITAMMGFLVFIAIVKILIKQNTLEARIYGSQKNTGLALLFTISMNLQPAAVLILSYALIQNLYFSYLTGRRVK
jgi:predicted Na+-dependent transporter